MSTAASAFRKAGKVPPLLLAGWRLQATSVLLTPGAVYQVSCGPREPENQSNAGPLLTPRDNSTSQFASVGVSAPCCLSSHAQLAQRWLVARRRCNLHIPRHLLSLSRSLSARASGGAWPRWTGAGSWTRLPGHSLPGSAWGSTSGYGSLGC